MTTTVDPLFVLGIASGAVLAVMLVFAAYYDRIERWYWSC